MQANPYVHAEHLFFGRGVKSSNGNCDGLTPMKTKSKDDKLVYVVSCCARFDLHAAPWRSSRTRDPYLSVLLFICLASITTSPRVFFSDVHGLWITVWEIAHVLPI